MGDLDVEPEVFDAARIRADEQVFEASGRTQVHDGRDRPGRRGGGLLRARRCRRTTRSGSTSGAPWSGREHRGHRLGLATKVHNLRRFQEQETGRKTVLFTYNAEVNRT